MQTVYQYSEKNEKFNKISQFVMQCLLAVASVYIMGTIGAAGMLFIWLGGILLILQEMSWNSISTALTSKKKPTPVEDLIAIKRDGRTAISFVSEKDFVLNMKDGSKMKGHIGFVQETPKGDREQSIMSDLHAKYSARYYGSLYNTLFNFLVGGAYVVGYSFNWSLLEGVPLWFIFFVHIVNVMLNAYIHVSLTMNDKEPSPSWVKIYGNTQSLEASKVYYSLNRQTLIAEFVNPRTGVTVQHVLFKSDN